MKFINDNPLKAFDVIDLENATLEEYRADVLDFKTIQYDIDETNYHLVCKYAIAQFDFLEKHENLSGYYFGNMRLIYHNLETFILEGRSQLAHEEVVNEFMYKYDELSVEIMYHRLGIDD